MNRSLMPEVRAKSWNADASIELRRGKKPGSYHIYCRNCGHTIKKAVHVINPMKLKRGDIFYFYGKSKYAVSNLVKGEFIQRVKGHLVYWNKNNPNGSMTVTRFARRKIQRDYFVEVKS